MPAGRPDRGFTLIEILVVIGIVAILAAIGAPALRDMVLAQRMKTVSLDLYSSLILARSEAVKRNANTVKLIAASGGWQNGWQVCVDLDDNGSCDATDIVLSSTEALEGIALSGPASNVVTYRRDGRISGGSSQLFTLISSVDSTSVPMRCVAVDVSGRPNTKVDTNHTDSDGCN